jgi:hypothetical protein
MSDKIIELNDFQLYTYFIQYVHITLESNALLFCTIVALIKRKSFPKSVLGFLTHD